MASLNPAISNVTGANQTSEDPEAIVTITTGTSRGVIVPFVANMYVDASGTVGTLQEVSVTMTGIDKVFDVTASAADAVKILNAFRIEDVNAGYGASDQAEISVSMKNRDDFIAGLASVIASGPVAGLTSLHNYLKTESRKDTVDILSYDSLVNLLEASDLLSFDVAIDASSGSTNMYDAMDDGNASYRKAIFAQIPKENVDTYATPSSDGTQINLEDVSGLNFLPLVKGDKLTFVFDVTIGEYTIGSNSSPSSGAKIHSVINDAATADPTGSYATSNTIAGDVSAANATSTYSGNQLLFTTPSARRVAITVQMDTKPVSGSGAFSLGEGGVAAGAELTA